MWFKKIFSREKDSSGEDKKGASLNDLQESEDIESSIYIDQEPDLRYSKLKIIKARSLTLPQDTIHFTEAIIFHQAESLEGRNPYSEWTKIQVAITDRQILISPDILMYHPHKSLSKANIRNLYYGLIQKIEYLDLKKQQPRVMITLKDERCVEFQSIRGDVIKTIEELTKQFCFATGINKMYAFKYGKMLKSKKHRGWDLYNFEKEMNRQGVLKFTTLNEGETNPLPFKLVSNKKGDLCSSYPQEIIVPSQMTQSDLLKCSKFRTRQRLPCLTYFYHFQDNNYACLFRCSQNKIGLMYSRCPEDEKMIASIDNAIRSLTLKSPVLGSKVNCKIYDARGYYAALGNKISGKGYEKQEYYHCQIQFLNIPNIHSVRNSYNKVVSYNPTSSSFIQVVSESGWIEYLSLILSGAKSMAKTMREGKNVVVHCSDGWDRTSQLAALAQIILDPYFRTLQGFAVLIEKDWRHFGHKFRERTSQYHPKDYHPHQKSPIFVQFLDCVFQLMSQFPLSFEFNMKLLVFLAIATQSYTYGTFLTNSIQQAKLIHLEQQTISIWSDVYENRQKYINFFYKSNQKAFLDVSVEVKDLSIWIQHFKEEKTENEERYDLVNKQLEINIQLIQKYEKNKQLIHNQISYLSQNVNSK